MPTNVIHATSMVAKKKNPSQNLRRIFVATLVKVVRVEGEVQCDGEVDKDAQEGVEVGLVTGNSWPYL